MREIKPMTAEDMESLIKEGVLECGITDAGQEYLRARAKEREGSGLCYSGYVDGKLVGCGGVDLYWNGVGEIWMVLSKDAKEVPLHTMKGVRAIFDKVLQENDLWRIQAAARCDFPEACRIVEMLGLTKDCTMKKYGPDESDYFLYSMVI